MVKRQEYKEVKDLYFPVDNINLKWFVDCRDDADIDASKEYERYHASAEKPKIQHPFT